MASLYGLDSSFLAWQSLAVRFASQLKSRISHLKRQLQNLQQGSLTCASYLTEAKFLADQLSAVGKPVDDDDLISFIIGGLNPTFTQFITSYSFHTREASMLFFDFRSELLNHEIIMNRHAPLNPALETSSFALFTNRPKFQPVKRKLQFSRSSNTNATNHSFLPLPYLPRMFILFPTLVVVPLTRFVKVIIIRHWTVFVEWIFLSKDVIPLQT